MSPNPRYEVIPYSIFIMFKYVIPWIKLWAFLFRALIGFMVWSIYSYCNIFFFFGAQQLHISVIRRQESLYNGTHLTVNRKRTPIFVFRFVGRLIVYSRVYCFPNLTWFVCYSSVALEDYFYFKCQGTLIVPMPHDW